MEMTLQQIRGRRQKLERDLREAISGELEKFKADTGWSVQGVDVTFVDVTMAQDSTRQAVISDVRVDLESI